MSRGTLDPAVPVRISCTGLSPSLAGFPKTILLNLSDQLRGPNPGMHAFRFGLFRFRSPLLTESHVVFSSSGYLDVSVHRVTSCMAIYSPYGTYTLLYVGSPIRTSADQRLFAPPRSLSQLVTSFFGSCCQGIRLMLLLA